VLDQPYYERTYMKKKQKDDILGEEQTDLPINEGMKSRQLAMFAVTDFYRSAWRLSEREVRIQAGILLPAADAEC
jgi:hypothetical protein